MENILKYLIHKEINFQKNGHDTFFQNRFDYASNLYSKDLKYHYSCVNSVEWSNSGEYMVSAGDDKRVLVWNVDRDLFDKVNGKIETMNAQHFSNVFTLAWDNEDKKIFSGGNDSQLIVHDVETKEVCDIFLHEDAVLGIAIHPEKSQIFATACESGQVSLYDLRLSNSDPIILASSIRNFSRDYEGEFISSDDSSSGSTTSSSNSVLSTGGAFQSCHFNPLNGNILAVANEISGLSLIDVRMNKTLLRYYSHLDSSNTNQNVMCVCFNRFGTHLAALRQSDRPVIYEVNNATPAYTFDSEGFSNSCTLKSCCFAGNLDQYLVTGSDDFSVNCWKIQSDIDTNDELTKLNKHTHLKLYGHRSIVNQCRYNRRFHLLASSGVEKIIKIWSPYELSGSSIFGDLTGKRKEYPPEREPNTFNELFRMRQNYQGGDNLIDANSIRNRIESIIEESVEENQTILSYFDTQIQRNSEGLKSTARQKRMKNSELLSRSFVNLTENSTNEEIETDITSREDDSESNEDDTDLSGNNSDTDLESPSNACDSSEEEKVNLSKMKNKSRYHTILQRTNKKNIPLRDRIRNLRHRRSLNLTQQKDYKNVLDSLNVDLTSNENEEHSDGKSKFFDKIDIPPIANNQMTLIENSSNELYLENSQIDKPGTSASFLDNKRRLKNLHMHKRKIEMNREESDSEDKTDKNEINTNEKVLFKKVKRTSKKTPKQETNQDQSTSE